MSLVLQAVAILGAGLVLGAYVALQRSRWTSDGVGYLWCNFIGALMLTIVAVADRRLGFILLEAVWAAVSLTSILRRTATVRES